MYENLDCFKFHDVVLHQILDAAFTLASTYHQTVSLFIAVGPFSRKVSMVFGHLASSIRLFGKFHGGMKSRYRTLGHLCSISQ